MLLTSSIRKSLTDWTNDLLSLHFLVILSHFSFWKKEKHTYNLTIHGKKVANDIVWCINKEIIGTAVQVRQFIWPSPNNASIYICLTYLNRFHRGEEMLQAYILSTWQAANKSWNISLLKTRLMRDIQQSRCLAMEVRWLEFLFLNIEAIKFVLQGVKQLTEICAKTTS